MSLIGTTTVFVVLVCLVGVVAMMGRWLAENAATLPAAQPTASNARANAGAASGEESDEQPEENLLLMALATYAYHRSRGASATAPTQTTEWSSAGRVRQIASFRR